jgi:hypothetical protein
MTAKQSGTAGGKPGEHASPVEQTVEVLFEDRFAKSGAAVGRPDALNGERFARPMTMRNES